MGIKLKNIVLLTIAGIINAFGVCCFIAPVQLYDSGISGTAILLSQITPLNLSIFLLLLNIPLFLYGLKKHGKTFTFYAIYTVAIYSLVAQIINTKFDVSFASPLAGTDLFLCAVFGGILSGIGSGLAIRGGGAMDGIEVAAVTLAKKVGISIGTFVMIYNVLLYSICGLLLKSWILPLYSIVTYAAGSKTVDAIVDGLDASKSALIITNNASTLCEAISNEFHIGVTVIEAKGWYSGADKTALIVVVNRFQVPKMKELVRALDPNAYVTISEVSDLIHGSKISK